MILLYEIAEFTFCVFFVYEEETTGKKMFSNADHQNNSIREYNLLIFLCMITMYTYTIPMHIYSCKLYTEIQTNTCDTSQCWNQLYELIHLGVHYCYVHYTFYLYSVKN